jgi:hypothetical protein
VVDHSSCGVTVIFGTCVFVINWFEGEDASKTRFASIYSAWILIITSNWGRNTSLYDIARMFGTFVCISARNRSMDAFSSVVITRIGGTCIAVITVNRSVDAFSRVSVTRNGFAVFFFADDRSEDAVSV